MICFGVSVNGEKLATAGLPGQGQVHVNVLRNQPRCAGNECEAPSLSVDVRGFDGDAHLDWGGMKLRVGDRVEIEVVEAEDAAAPVREKRDDEALAEMSERKYYERLKKKYEP